MDLDPDVKSKIESLLYVSTKSVSLAKMSKLFDVPIERLKLYLETLIIEYNGGKRGLFIVMHEDNYKLSVNPDNYNFIRGYVKGELRAELSGPALEALTIILYRGPITKQELELIRGVNCSIILRNLMIKGLIKSNIFSDSNMQKYSVTMDFLKYLGIGSVKEMPNYKKWNSNEIIEKLLNKEEE